MMEGWIKIHRQIKEHWIWENPIYLKAWLTILITVNHEDKKILIEKELIECHKGQSLLSLSGWSKLFGKGWTIQKVRTFFELLRGDVMITTEGLRKTTRLTVCNYALYQNGQQADNKQTTSRQQADNNKQEEEKNEKKEKKIDFAEFWNLYDHKLGNKEKCKIKWDKIEAETQIKIISILPAYLKTIKDKQFQPYPETWLNQKRWENEDLIFMRRNGNEQLDKHGKLRPSSQHCLVNGEWTVI